MSDFTPGPWAINKYGGIGRGILGTRDYEVIVDTEGFRYAPNAEANMRLVAAAPDLLAAAKAISELDDGDEPFAWRHQAKFEQLRAAIASAEGR